MSKHAEIENNTENRSNLYVRPKYYLNSSELFKSFPRGILDKYVTPWYGEDTELAGEIFTRCFYEVLLDVINNDAIFVLPLKNDYAEINMTTVSGDDFIKAYKNGKFQNIDFVKSNFSASYPTYVNKRGKSVTLYVTGWLRDAWKEKYQ